METQSAIQIKDVIDTIDLKRIMENQKHKIEQNRSLPLSEQIKERKYLLKRLLKTVQKYESDICSALAADFGKPIFESVATETRTVEREIKNTLKWVEKWAQPKSHSVSLLNFPSSNKVYNEPYGVTLLISPWNYPYQLAITPLIAAIAAGNSVVLKPSELTPHTSLVTQKICEEVFPMEWVKVFQGAVEVSTALLEQRWDMIFFTGSVGVGKIIAKAAAKHLTPTVLELGGKNPCVIDETANIDLAAKRITWGKFMNAGQTCIAPDYILVHESKYNELVKGFKKYIKAFYSSNPQTTSDFARIINDRNFSRLAKMLEGEEVLEGGVIDHSTCYIAPTLIGKPKLNSEVMKDEIFGPILPILTYQTEEDLHRVINRYEKPLSFYMFSSRTKKANKIVQKYSFGGGVINDVVVYFVNDHLPFGGVGYSGVGSYHGKFGFDAYSHAKPVVKRGNWLDLPVRYAPYQGKLGILKKFLKYF